MSVLDSTKKVSQKTAMSPEQSRVKKCLGNNACAKFSKKSFAQNCHESRAKLRNKMPRQQCLR
jgi:hypothetical protein